MLFCRFCPEIYPNVRFASIPSLFFIIPGFPDTKLICWAALLNNQPLGFYPTDVLSNDAKRRSIRILPVDVNRSDARCTVESKGAVRLSLTCVKGLSLSKAQRVEAARRTGKFVSIKDFVRRTQLDCSVIERWLPRVPATVSTCPGGRRSGRFGYSIAGANTISLLNRNLRLQTFQS